MPSATFPHECTQCQHQYEQSTYWVDPELYTDPEKALKTFGFWCPKQSCARGQAVVLQMLPDTEVAIVEVLGYDTLIREDSSSYYSHSKSTSDNNESPQKVTEDLSLSVLGQVNTK